MRNRLSARLTQAWLAIGSRNSRVLLLDTLLLVFAVYLGFALRVTLLITPNFRGELFFTALLYTPCIITSFYLGGLYKIFWPQASIEEYARLARHYVFGSAFFLLANFLAKELVIPRTSLAIMLFAGLFFLVGMRASLRLAKISEHRHPLATKRTLIIGAGEAGTYLARDLMRKESELLPIGFIDNDPTKQKTIIAGLPVLGGDSAISEVIDQHQISVTLLALPSASGTQIRHYLDLLSHSNGVEVRVLPSLRDLAGGQIEVSRLRSVSLEDLLRREPIRLDMHNIQTTIEGKVIMVTGAGGSIGSEICRQVLPYRPKHLILLGHGEQSLYLLVQSLISEGVSCPYTPIVADIADACGMRNLFEHNKPHVIFHAAAHKHVPLMEINPRESLRVNALGTWTLAQLAGEFGVEKVVMISSDKAVNPTSVMGATKRVAEKLLTQVQTQHPTTHYMAVRFGNVLGSRGSVVPLFEKQIKNGGPLTVTHPEMKRYFMLIPEAVSLVLQAGTMGTGHGELYVLDMGEPVNITEMAETLIRLHGLEPYKDIAIQFTGIRAGEKLYEELFYDQRYVDTTQHEKIFLTRLEPEREPLIHSVKNLLSVQDMTPQEFRRNIFDLL